MIGVKFQLKLTILTFGPNLPKKDITNQKQKKHTSVCVHGRYLQNQTFLHGGQQTQCHFNVSSPFSHRDRQGFSRCRLKQFQQQMMVPHKQTLLINTYLEEKNISHFLKRETYIYFTIVKLQN